MLCVLVGDVMDVVFSVCIVRRGTVGKWGPDLDTELIITIVYIPPASSCAGGYLISLYHLMMKTDTLIRGDISADHSACYSRGTQIA